MPHGTPLFAKLGEDRVIIFLFKGLLLSVIQKTVGIDIVHVGRSIFHDIARQGIFGCGVLGGVAFSSGQLKQAVVWLRCHDVVLNFHYLATSCAHQRSSVVTVAEFLWFLAGEVLDILLTHKTFGIHSYQGSEAVSAVNVHTLSHWTQTMGGIHITAVLHIILHAPMQVVGIVVVRILPVRLPKSRQFVDVSAFSPNDFAEYSILSHGQGIHLIIVIAAVL